MIVVAVRVCESKEFVGIYWAQNVGAVWHQVDEDCPPGACEYARLRAGGLFAVDDDGPKLEDRVIDENGEGGFPVPKVIPTQRLAEALDLADQLEWRRLVEPE